MSNKLKTAIKTAVCVIFWIGAWEILSLCVNQSVILPSPLSTLKKLWALLGTGDFYVSCLSSLARIFAGFLAGVALGAALAALSYVGGEFIISPAVAVIKATPVASIIIVLLFFIRRDIVPITATLLIVIPIIYSNILKGIRSVPKDISEVALVYGFGAGKKMKYCVMPTVAPFFSAGVTTAVGISWKAGVAAEVLCTPKLSIGSALWDAKAYLESEELFAWTLTVILLSFVIEKLLVAGISKLTGGKNVRGK
ncbi:MAG: ABC transporter permease subunit [Clostridia bacterium]|nr:ABC transporter permease subunit [Clostridia bacterium]